MQYNVININVTFQIWVKNIYVYDLNSNFDSPFGLPMYPPPEGLISM